MNKTEQDTYIPTMADHLADHRKEQKTPCGEHCWCYEVEKELNKKETENGLR